MNKLQLFTRYYITKVERGVDQSRSRGTELPCKLREGLSLLMRRLVYSFTCRCCSATYMGQTVRHLHTRVSEHLGVSPLTGSKSSNPTMSSILSHLDSTGHSASLNDFKIISCCSSPDELLIRESLLINKLKPSLNLQGSSVPLLLL